MVYYYDVIIKVKMSCLSLFMKITWLVQATYQYHIVHPCSLVYRDIVQLLGYTLNPVNSHIAVYSRSHINPLDTLQHIYMDTPVQYKQNYSLNNK